MPPLVEANEPSWKTIAQLVSRSRGPDSRGRQVSISDTEVPNWQRDGNAWSDEQRGMLALSIIQGYPIGQILLWEKPNRSLVPIDGRQRLTAILAFAENRVSIPSHPWVPEEYRGRRRSDDPKTALSLEDVENFNGYALDVRVFPSDTPEPILMEMFVRLQNGSALNKAEVRAALGTKIAEFVTELTSRVVRVSDEDEDEPTDEVMGGHLFFRNLTAKYANRRKSHRKVCDQLLNEHLKGDTMETFSLDNHWESLLKLYREYELRESEKTGFKKELTAFDRAFQVDGHLSRALYSPNLISTWYRVWRFFRANYATSPRIPWGELSEQFERIRIEQAEIEPFRSFKTAIEASGYTSARNQERADIVRRWIVQEIPTLMPKDRQRLFTSDQKYVIWHRAGGRCEWLDVNNERCKTEIDNPTSATGHADHVIRHSEGGPTTIDNGRFLCAPHNLARQ